MLPVTQTLHEKGQDENISTQNFYNWNPQAEIRIGDIELNEKDVFHYLFDFGDDWWHRIRVQKIGHLQALEKHMKLIKSVGKSPNQYPDYADEY